MFKIYGFDWIATVGLSSTGANPKILYITRKKCGPHSFLKPGYTHGHTVNGFPPF